MNTELLPFSEQSAKKAAEIMAAGGVVGIPTETVYGLAADARNEAAGQLKWLRTPLRQSGAGVFFPSPLAKCRTG